MTASTKSTGKYWIMFLLSLVATCVFLVFLPEWFWVTLPFLFTGFAKAMDWL